MLVFFLLISDPLLATYMPDYENLNGTMPGAEDPFLIWPVKHCMILFFTLAFILGLAGNLLVLFVIIRNKSMQTVTNFFSPIWQ